MNLKVKKGLLMYSNDFTGWKYSYSRENERMSAENQWLEDVFLIEIVPFLGTCWVVPHQDHYIFSRESRTKPSFPLLLGGGTTQGTFVRFRHLVGATDSVKSDPATYAVFPSSVSQIHVRIDWDDLQSMTYNSHMKLHSSQVQVLDLQVQVLD